MCGIVGMLAKRQRGFLSDDVMFFWQMLVVDSLRGSDGTGVWGTMPSGNVGWTKIGGNPYALAASAEYDAWEKRAKSSMTTIIGHNRFATSGGTKSDQAHPFVKDHIIMCHNGAIMNHEEIRPDAPKGSVDSESVAYLLAREPDVVKAIESLEGAYAIVWYDAKEMKTYFVHNEERPLHYLETDDSIIIMSEKVALDFLSVRNSVGLTVETLAVPTDKIFCWDHDTRQMSSMDYKPKKSDVVLTYADWFAKSQAAKTGNDTGWKPAVVTPKDGKPDHSTTLERFVKAIPIGSTITIAPTRVLPWDIPQTEGRRLEAETKFEEMKVTYKYSGSDTERLESLGKAKFITGVVVSHLLASDHIAVWLKNVEERPGEAMWKSFNDVSVTFKEWQKIVKEVPCRKCGNFQKGNALRLTSLQYKKGHSNWSAVCAPCTIAAFKDASDATQTLMEAKAGFNVIDKARSLGLWK